MEPGHPNYYMFHLERVERERERELEEFARRLVKETDKSRLVDLDDEG